MTPSVSIVVCTRDRAIAVGDVLRDLVADAPADAEIVVVDQSDPADRDATATTIARLADPRIVHRPAPAEGLPAARNLGVAETRGVVVLFLDDDVRLQPGCVGAHVGAYDDPAIGGVVGGIEERLSAPNAAHTSNRVGVGGRVRTRLDGDVAVDVATLKGANMSFRRVALAAAGPADARYAGTAFLEDADWSTRVRRLGWRLRFVPEAAVVHLSVPSGGCRVASALEREASRFRNTGLFVRTHRPWTTPSVVATFTAIAAKRALAWGPSVLPVLLGALLDGLRQPREGFGSSSRSG